MWGRVEDTYLLDNITMAIREGIIGANGFRADYAVIVTWERMAYGGAPKVTQVGGVYPCNFFSGERIARKVHRCT